MSRVRLKDFNESLFAEESKFAAAVRRELAGARLMHGGRWHSLHEAFAIILEEIDELWDECRKKRSKRKKADILAELVQIGATAQRAAEDLGLIRDSSSSL